jgi:hypothetical protein
MNPTLTLLSALLLAPLATLHGADVVDQQESVSPSDLVYDRPAETPDAGQPIGNGRMGTMVWTSPAAVHLQINRVDWIWTTEMLYFPLLAADAIDLMAPYFNMYVRQLPNCEKAAQQRWGISGAYFPETTSFDGPTVLPDDVAIEFQADGNPCP